MIIEDFPVRTPCCRRIAMRVVATVIHIDGEYPGIAGEVARGLGRGRVCPYCGSNLAIEDCHDVRHFFNDRMMRYIFAGIPALASQ